MRIFPTTKEGSEETVWSVKRLPSKREDWRSVPGTLENITDAVVCPVILALGKQRRGFVGLGESVTHRFGERACLKN